MMAKRICIMGAGPGGYVAAVRAAQLGADVTLIEKEAPGGTCLNWGCIPSKVLIATADLFAHCRGAADFAIALQGSVSVDMALLMARKERVIQDQRKGLHSLFAHHRIHYHQGTAKVLKTGVTEVRPPDGPAAVVAWDRLILATGSRPMDLPGLAVDGRHVLSSNDALTLDRVPSSLLIVGGGVIGCEFAHIFGALGAQVTVVEAMDRLLPLPSVDVACSKVLQREMKKRRVTCMTHRTVQSIGETKEGLRVVIGPSPFNETPSAKEKAPAEIRVATVLVAVGRTPNTDGIGLEQTRVELDERGWVKADDRMQTADPAIYAVGDVLGPNRVMLAHAASAEGSVAADNALGGDRRMEYRAVPGAIFTSPEVATVGLTESQARAVGHAVRSDEVLFRTLGKAQVIGAIAGQAKIVSDTRTGQVLGVHIIGPHATELIAEGALAVNKGLTVEDLAGTIHAHPTLAEIIGETALKAVDRPLHG
jgi:dihydrolipoamide dehydrogenase